MRTLISAILFLVGFLIFLLGMALMFSALSAHTDRSTEGWMMLGAILSGIMALVGAGIAFIGYKLNKRRGKVSQSDESSEARKANPEEYAKMMDRTFHHSGHSGKPSLGKRR